jgi:hypothetical protein
MRNLSRYSIAALAIVLLAVGHVQAQPDPNLKPTFGAVTLKAGFLPDPYTKELVAGGPLRTDLGGVNAHVAKAPDFSLHYTAGNFALTITARSKGDTTLLINLPDGSWVADDDSGGDLNPLLRFTKPQSGRYDIYVGTFGKDTVPATLIITERGAAPPPAVAKEKPKGNLPDCYIVSAGVDNYRNANKLNGCLNDARNTVNAFKAQAEYAFRKVEAQTLLDGTATRANIHSKFQGFTQQGKAGDYMVLFLSGHGGRTNGDKTWYFLPFDFHPQNAGATILTDKHLLDTGDAIVKQKKNVVIIIDACFCGQLHATAQPYLNRYKNAQQGGMILMLSSSATQTSAALGQYSAFAKAFADSMTASGDLNRDGRVTLDEIQTYSFRRTAQLLNQSRNQGRQDSIVAWSPSISKDTPFAVTGTPTTVAAKAPTGNAKRWAGTESLAGYGKLSFALYPGGRAVMIDAKNTVEGTWQQTDNQVSLTFFDGSVVYSGTVNDSTMSGTATAPGARMDQRRSWTWSVKTLPGN